jgi:ABC-type methionine transport system ATPase subunit
MSSINTHIVLVNKEIEIVKSHIQELIGIDVSNLATLGDLTNLEDALKQYTDEAVGSVDLSDYPTKTRYQI